MRKCLVSLFFILVSQISFAAVWQLNDSKSSLYFESTKNETIKEINKFKKFSGTIDDGKGTAQLEISLNSVDTHIPLRDERIRELLFETALFPIASFTAEFNPKHLAKLNDMHAHTIPLVGILNLHGVKHEIDTQVVVQKINADSVQIKNAEPIVLDTDNYNLQMGIAALTKIAGLKSIDTSVPVSFQLVFDKK